MMADQEKTYTNDDGSCAIPPPTTQAYAPSLYERVRMRGRVDPPASHLTVPDEVLATLEQMKRQRCETEDDDDENEEGTPRCMECEPAPQRRCPHTAGTSLCTHFWRDARALQPEQCPAVAMKRTRESVALDASVLEHKRLKT